MARGVDSGISFCVVKLTVKRTLRDAKEFSAHIITCNRTGF